MSVLDIVIPYGPKKRQDRLEPAGSGLPNLTGGGFTWAQVQAIGTDLAGNAPTFGQIAAAGGNNAVTESLAKASELSTALTGNVADLGGNGLSVDIPWYEELFQRGAIIILGFIFVAIGLSMFNRGEGVKTIVMEPARKAATVATEGSKAAAANV